MTMTDDQNEATMDLLAKTVRNAIEAQRLSVALAELLVAKGVLTNEEVADQMRLTESIANDLQELTRRMRGHPADLK
jgi:membrane-bound ClpP family serine protease